MSGGHFDYLFYRLDDFADRLERDIQNNSKQDEWGYARNYSDTTIRKLAEYVLRCKFIASAMKEIEWLYSSDTSEEEFLQNIEKLEIEFFHNAMQIYYESHLVKP